MHLEGETFSRQNGTGRRTLAGALIELRGLKARGLNGVELVVSDDHAGLKVAIREILAEAVWQRC